MLKIKSLPKDGKVTEKTVKYFQHYYISIFKSPPRKCCLFWETIILKTKFSPGLECYEL